MKEWFLIAVMTLPLSGLAQRLAYGDNDAAGKFYPINGFRMYCEQYGSGKPLLMIHGNGGSIRAFTKNISFFASRFNVIVADSRAQGRSADAQDTLSFEMMADDYAALLTTLHLDSCYVIGWSDGGIIALLLAMRHPEKVKMLASSGANIWPDSTALMPRTWKDMQAEARRFKANPYITNEQRNERKLFYLDFYQPHISTTMLRKVRCPSLIISGDRDVIRLEHTLLIYQHIPKARLWVLPNSGHGLPSDYSKEFNQVVGDFFLHGTP